MRQRSARYQKLASLVEKRKTYPLNEAFELVCQTSKTRFPGSLEIHARLAQGQNVRTWFVLPHPTGKTLKLLVFADEAQAEKARSNGADRIGDDKTIDTLAAGKLPYDKILSTPDWMPRLTPLARILGPKGLLPNPKDGTLTQDVARAVLEFKKSRVEVKTENSPVLHLIPGKLSAPKIELKTNLVSTCQQIRKLKTQDGKPILLRSLFLTSTMGPAIKVDLNSLPKE